jgi:hypothetical protein
MIIANTLNASPVRDTTPPQTEVTSNTRDSITRIGSNLIPTRITLTYIKTVCHLVESYHHHQHLIPTFLRTLTFIIYFEIKQVLWQNIRISHN